MMRQCRLSLVPNRTRSLDTNTDDGKIKVLPARPRYDLADLLKGEPTSKKKRGPREVDWGAPKGRETW